MSLVIKVILLLLLIFIFLIGFACCKAARMTQAEHKMFLKAYVDKTKYRKENV